MVSSELWPNYKVRGIYEHNNKNKVLGTFMLARILTIVLISATIAVIIGNECYRTIEHSYDLHNSRLD